ncbi:MAG: CynX/NimT family MFS transporter [Candidatus Hadarchaeota archaeon]
MISLTFILSFLLHLLLFCTAPMVDHIMGDMGLTNAQFGIIFSAAMASLLLLRIPWGIVGDRIGYLKTLRISLIIISISAIMRGLVDGYKTFIASQFILGIGLASLLPCFPLLIREWFSKRSGLATGIYVSGFAIGNGTALGLTPYLIQIMEWRSVLILYGTFSLFVTISWWILAKSEEKTRSEGVAYTKFFDLIRRKKIIILILLMTASMGCYDTLATWMPKVLELRSLSKSPSLFLSFGFFLSGPSIGYISDKLENEGILICTMGILSALSIATIIYAPTYLLWIILILSGFSLMAVLTLTLKIPASAQDLRKARGKVTGIVSSISNIGPMLFPVAFGYLMDITSTYILSFLMLVAIVLLIIPPSSRALYDSST